MLQYKPHGHLWAAACGLPFTRRAPVLVIHTHALTDTASFCCMAATFMPISPRAWLGPTAGLAEQPRGEVKSAAAPVG